MSYPITSLEGGKEGCLIFFSEFFVSVYVVISGLGETNTRLILIKLNRGFVLQR